jgi:hypothetical protein
MTRSVRFIIWFLVLCSLTSCDFDPFGFDTKRVAGEWRLVETETGFALMHDDVGGYVSEIGWQKPVIISRAERSEAWDVVDTSTRKQVSISDQQRRSDPALRDIPVFPAGDAWARLKHWRRQW